MDFDGNRELIYEGTHNVWHAMPVEPRRQPPEQPDRVAWPGKGRDAAPPSRAASTRRRVRGRAGSAREQREVPARVPAGPHDVLRRGTSTLRCRRPCVSIVQEDGVKRILGTVPVDEDGSVVLPGAPREDALFPVAGRALSGPAYDALLHRRDARRDRAVASDATRCTVRRRQPAGVRLAASRQHRWRLHPGATRVSDTSDSCSPCSTVLWRCHQGDGEGRDELDLTLRPGYRFHEGTYLTLLDRRSGSNRHRGSNGTGSREAGCGLRRHPSDRVVFAGGDHPEVQVAQSTEEPSAPAIRTECSWTSTPRCDR